MTNKAGSSKSENKSEGSSPSAKKAASDDNDINAVPETKGAGVDSASEAGDADEVGKLEKQVEVEEEEEEGEEVDVEYILDNAEVAESVGRTIEALDTLKVKQVLDDSLLALLTEMNYECDQTSENWKLFLMTLACCCGLLAQFYPAPWPANRLGVGICVAGYFLISGVLQFIISFMDGELVVTTLEGKGYQSVADFTVLKQTQKAEAEAKSKRSKGSDTGTDNTDIDEKEVANQTHKLFLERNAMQVHTAFDKYQEFYSLRLNKVEVAKGSVSFSGGGDSSENKERTVACMYVGKYFTISGEFDERRFWADVCRHIALFEKGSYGSFTYDHTSEKSD